MFTGLAMLNQQTEPVEVTVEAFDKDGILSASRTLILEPRTRIVGLLTDPEFFGGLFEQIGGYIRVDGQVVSIALFGGQGFLSAIGGQEPLN